MPLSACSRRSESGPGVTHNGLVSWLDGSGDARSGWEFRLVILTGFILLICLAPSLNDIVNNELTGLLIIGMFILVYGFVAGRLLALLDRRRRAPARDPE